MNKDIFLTIGGHDPLSSGGIQTDLKTFEDLDVFGMSVISNIVTVGDDQYHITPVEPELLIKQLEIFYELKNRIAGIKIGLIGSLENIEIIEQFLDRIKNSEIHIIIDPIISFKESNINTQSEYIVQLQERLFKYADLVTPNLQEAELLTNISINNIEDAKNVITKIRGEKIIIKNIPNRNKATDIFFSKTQNEMELLSLPLITTPATNGAGDAFATALSVYLSRESDILSAINKSKKFVHSLIDNGFVISEKYGSVWKGNLGEI